MYLAFGWENLEQVRYEGHSNDVALSLKDLLRLGRTFPYTRTVRCRSPSLSQQFCAGGLESNISQISQIITPLITGLRYILIKNWFEFVLELIQMRSMPYLTVRTFQNITPFIMTAIGKFCL